MLRLVTLHVFSALAALAAPIVVTNPSFELLAISTPGAVSGSHPGWTGGFVFRPTATSVPSVPDGLQVMFLQSTSNSVQTLADTLVADSLYTLLVDVGSRADFNFINTYTISLEAGSNVLATISSPTPANGAFVTAMLQYASTASSPGLGQPLSIRLAHTAASSATGLFDNVRLDAAAVTGIPEPSSLALIGAGLVVLSSLGRRRK